MHDIRAIRSDPLAFDSALARRGVASIAQSILDLDSARRAIQTEVQAGLARRNEASKAIGQAKAKGDEATAGALMEEVSALKARLPELEAEERRLGEERSEEHTSELQSLMRISYAVFCLKKKKEK